MNFHIDNFDDERCRAGGVHQWLGDGLIYYKEDRHVKSMNARQFSLLSPAMQKQYDIVGGEVTCNKCGATYTAAHNPNFL